MESSLYLLVPLSLLLVFLIAALFWWSVRSGQYDDLEGPAYRVLFDDDVPGRGDVSRSDHAGPTSKLGEPRN